MTRKRVLKIVLDNYGDFLGVERGCFVVRDAEGNERRYPKVEDRLGEVIIKTGSTISTGALVSLGYWKVPVLVTTRWGRPIAVFRSLADDSHVKTRIHQYKALENGKGDYIAKKLVKARIEGQNILLLKYGLKPHKKAPVLEDKYLMGLEGKYTRDYFEKIFMLFPEDIRPDGRKGFQAYEGLNNVFNLVYEMLRWKVYKAIIRAKLDPFLGYLHTTRYAMPSLTCDLQEIYRHIADDFIIGYSKDLSKRDFVIKYSSITREKRGKREFLSDSKTQDLIGRLVDYFEGIVELPSIRRGSKQAIETLINEEAQL